MSYGLSAFLMSDGDVHILGCKDFDLCTEVIAAMNGQFEAYDEMLDFEDENQVSTRMALREIFADEITRPEFPEVYGWAYELYCSSMGDRLNTNPFSPCSCDWYMQLDQFLASQDTPLRFNQLISDCPIAIPEPDDWPYVGHWPHNTIANASNHVDKFIGAIEDQDLADAFDIIRDWFTLAKSQPESIIVGFHG